MDANVTAQKNSNGAAAPLCRADFAKGQFKNLARDLQRIGDKRYGPSRSRRSAKKLIAGKASSAGLAGSAIGDRS